MEGAESREHRRWIERNNTKLREKVRACGAWWAVCRTQQQKEHVA